MGPRVELEFPEPDKLQGRAQALRIGQFMPAAGPAPEFDHWSHCNVKSPIRDFG